MSSDDQKLKRLNAVFVKALDMTTDSITQSELKQSFQIETGGISHVENVFVNTIGKMKQSMEDKFFSHCQSEGVTAIHLCTEIVGDENDRNQKTKGVDSMMEELQVFERDILAKEIEKVSDFF